MLVCYYVLCGSKSIQIPKKEFIYTLKGVSKGANLQPVCIIPKICSILCFILCTLHRMSNDMFYLSCGALSLPAQGNSQHFFCIFVRQSACELSVFKNSKKHDYT